ncbi:hypothetical protein EES39_07330 [Streptomyces sp. ADI92-24]|nr:hypothetical protein EDD95_0173 [Streptomyces sp. CEV 2-1]RPK49493.1 hypothetical protein EES39_07330 [Streptomyces sp. ADI92-24]
MPPLRPGRQGLSLGPDPRGPGMIRPSGPLGCPAIPQLPKATNDRVLISSSSMPLILVCPMKVRPST